MRATVGVCVLYAIQPISKKTCKDTLTLLNLRKSKKKQNKHIAQPLFQVIANVYSVQSVRFQVGSDVNMHFTRFLKR